MANHGQLINSRTYWTYTGPDGKPAVSDTPPGGGSTPFGVGSTAPQSTQYQEQTYEDGTKVLSRWDPAKDSWVQESIEVDPGIRGQSKDAAAAASPDTTPKTVTTADGRVLQYEPKTDTWKEVGPPRTPAADSKAPEIQTLPDGSQVQWDPASKAWKPFATAKAPPAEAGKVPSLDVGPTRPGQRTDLTGVKAQHDAFVAGLNADKTLTPEERNKRYQTYMATVVQPQLDRAAQEANAEADRQAQRQAQQDRIAEQNASLANRREDRVASAQDRTAQTAEDRLAFDQEKESYSHGRDAVADALALMKYRVDPSFSPSLAGIYNGILGGSGQSFAPNAFQFNLPDLDAIAQSHVGPLLAAQSTPAFAPGAAGPPAAMPGVPPTVPPAIPPAAAPGAVPPATPANRDQWARR